MSEGKTILRNSLLVKFTHLIEYSIIEKMEFYVTTCYYLFAYTDLYTFTSTLSPEEYTSTLSYVERL